jgi:sec-independent protein translocase protein TatB
MFEIGWTEILVIAVVAIVIFPTKDLPRLLRTVGQMVSKGRRMAGDFQSQFNKALREAELEADLMDTRQQIKDLNPLTDVRKALDPIRSIGDDLKRTLAAPLTPMESPSPAAEDEEPQLADLALPVATPAPANPPPAPVPPPAPAKASEPQSPLPAAPLAPSVDAAAKPSTAPVATTAAPATSASPSTQTATPAPVAPIAPSTPVPASGGGSS